MATGLEWAGGGATQVWWGWSGRGCHLHESLSQLDQLACVLPEDVHTHDGVRRRALRHQLQRLAGERLKAAARHRHCARARQVLSLLRRADSGDVTADRGRVSADALHYVEAVWLRGGGGGGEADEGHLPRGS